MKKLDYEFYLYTGEEEFFLVKNKFYTVYKVNGENVLVDDFGDLIHLSDECLKENFKEELFSND